MACKESRGFKWPSLAYFCIRFFQVQQTRLYRADGASALKWGFMPFFRFWRWCQRTACCYYQLLHMSFWACLATAIAERLGSGDDYTIFLYYSYLTQLPIFPIGMFVYGLSHREVTLTRTDIGIWVAVWLVVALVARVGFHLTSRPLFWFQVMVLAAAVGSSIRWNWATKWLAYVGRLSYSMYLFHFAVLFFLERIFGNGWSYLVGMAATLSITIAIAVVSQATAERWSQELARYLIGSLKGGRVAIAQA